ncbi:hypothetical protein ABPG75_009848 [Micractinium tetrahymenae]
MRVAAAPPVAGIRLADLFAKAAQETSGGAGAGGLAILYSGEDADLLFCKEVADYIYGEAKSKLTGVSVSPPAALSAAPPAQRCKAALILGAAGPGVDAERAAAAWLDGPGACKGMSFAILGVGDSASADMQPPRALRQRLLAAGAVEVQAMAECSQAEMGQVLEPWAASLWPPLKKALPPADEGVIKAVPAGLFQRLGATEGLAAIFDVWLRKAQADWRVRRFLEGAQEEATRAQMGQWLCATLGGPIPYRGPDPAALCTMLIKDKGLNGTHLDTLIQHLAGSMSERGIPADAIDLALEAVSQERRRLGA